MVAGVLEELGEVEPIGALHRVPTHGLLEGLDRRIVVAEAHLGEREVAVDAVERLAHVVELARVLLDAPVGDALEYGREAEPLLGVGGLAVPPRVFLYVRRERGKEVTGLLVLPCHQQLLGAQHAFRRDGVAHASPFLFWPG